MKSVIKIIHLGLAIFLICSILNVVKPYMGKYWLEMQLERVAVFGIKHNMSDTVNLLISKMRVEGYEFEEDDFVINKDKDNNVSISITFNDEIGVLGVTLKELTLHAEASALDVKSFY